MLLLIVYTSFNELNSTNNRLLYFSNLSDNSYNKLIKSIENNAYPIVIANFDSSNKRINIESFKQNKSKLSEAFLFIKISLFILIITTIFLMFYYFYRISRRIFLNENNLILSKYIKVEGILIFVLSVLYTFYLNIYVTIARELIDFPSNIIYDSIKQTPYMFLVGSLIILFSSIISNIEC